MTGGLRVDANVEDADGFYARLLELHEGLDARECMKLNAKLILMLANHIGDRAVLDEALEYLRRTRPARP